VYSISNEIYFAQWFVSGISSSHRAREWLSLNDDYVTEGWIHEIDPSKGGYPAYGPVIDEMNKEANAYLPAPEPTTATLSLMALAGLAARCRRK